jgi:hypothetical protein
MQVYPSLGFGERNQTFPNCPLHQKFNQDRILDKCKRDLGIDLRIARRIQQSGVVLEPETDIVEIPIERVLGTVSRFVMSWVPIELFRCLYRHIVTDQFLRDYGQTQCRDDIISFAMSLVDENARSWSSSKDLGIGFTDGLNNCKSLATHGDFA